MAVTMNLTRFRVVSRDIRNAMSRGLRAAADEIVERADASVPVATGDLQSTGRVIQDPGDLRAQVVYGGQTGAATGDDVDYAAYVEHGTSTMAAQPYLAPAVATVDLRAHIDAEVAKLIRGAL